MFARGNWAVLGVNPDSHLAFQASLHDPSKMLLASQLLAGAMTRHLELEVSGINPFSDPRMDEKEPPNVSEASAQAIRAGIKSALAIWAAQPKEERGPLPPVLDLADYELNFAYGAARFELGQQRYGLWFVQNEWKDVSHLASIKEAVAYQNLERPYKFATGEDKKMVDLAAQAKTAPKRNQFPVLIDFAAGRAYLQTTNKDAILGVIDMLNDLGVETHSLAWSFDVDAWPARVVQTCYDRRSHAQEFTRWAADSARFTPEEMKASIDDQELLKLLTTYFSTTALETEAWASLAPAAQVRLHEKGDPLPVQSSTAVTELLALANSSLAGASLTLQERVSKFNKKTESERVFRVDLLSIDVSDQMNLSELGVALLRGFDMPRVKKDLLKQIKQTHQVPAIHVFWSAWLSAMNNAVAEISESLRSVLEVKDGGLLQIESPNNDEVIEG